ncbi:MAG: LysR family transcriptional regulator [Lachnospiraceae bacterium]
MDLKQLEYIIKIAEEQNITKAAAKLYITQSALNQQLLKLEKDLGTPLFSRSRHSCIPTEAGEVYIENARRILNIRTDTYNRISDIADTRRGHITIGLAPGRGIAMFTAVYPRFRQMYPDVVISPIELGVRRQQELIAEGNLDLGFMTLNRDQRSKDEYIDLYSEEFFLAVPSIHPISQLAAPAGQPFSELDIRQVQYEPFVLMFQESTVREMVDRIFQDAGFEPTILFETSSTASIVSMISGNLCCGIIPHHYVADSQGITFFALPSHPTWDITVSYRKHGYLSQPMKDFIRLAEEYWSKRLAPIR